MKAWLVTLLAMFAWMLPIAARADDRKAVVIYTEGDDAKALASELEKNVPDGLTARDGSSVSSALDKRKIKNKLGATLANKKERSKAIDALAEAASQSDVAAVVTASAKKPPKGPRTVTIVIVKGGEKSPEVESAANDPSARQSAMSKTLAPLVPAPQKPPPPKETPTTTTPTPTETPTTDNPPPTTEPASSSDDLSGIGRSTALVYAGGVYAMHFLEYNQPVTQNLRDYQLYASFQFTVGGELYPLARTRIPFVRDLGVEARWARSLGLDSRIPNGPKVDTVWERFYIGARGRIRLGKGETPPMLGLGVGYGRWVFVFDDAGNPVSASDPAERHHQLLFSVDARWDLAKHFALHGGVGGGPIFIDDPMSIRFRHTSAGEVLFKGGVAIPIVPHLEVRATITYDRFFFAFNSKRNDAYAAGGALDHNLFGTLEVGAWF